jgi:hypothetical protein
MLREQGRDLHAEFLRLLPERPRPIRIQRWSARRVGLLLLVVVPLAALLALGFQQLPAGLAAVSFNVVRTRP